MVDAFVTIRGVCLTAEKNGVRSNVKVNSVQKRVEVKDNSGSFIKKGLGLCKKNDCWLNVTKVSHKFGNPGEANVRQKKSEGIPPSRGKPTQGTGGGRGLLPAGEGGEPSDGRTGGLRQSRPRESGEEFIPGRGEEKGSGGDPETCRSC